MASYFGNWLYVALVGVVGDKGNKAYGGRVATSVVSVTQFRVDFRRRRRRIGIAAAAAAAGGGAAVFATSNRRRCCRCCCCCCCYRFHVREKPYLTRAP